MRTASLILSVMLLAMPLHGFSVRVASIAQRKSDDVDGGDSSPQAAPASGASGAQTDGAQTEEPNHPSPSTSTTPPASLDAPPTTASASNDPQTAVADVGENADQAITPVSAETEAAIEKIAAHPESTSFRGASSAVSCHDEVVKKHDELMAAVGKSVDPNSLSPLTAPPPAGAIREWCVHKFTQAYPAVPRELTLDVCVGLKRSMDEAIRTKEKGGVESNGDLVASRFCEMAEHRYLEAFSSIVAGQQLGGTDIPSRYQLPDASRHVTRRFYGERAHNSLDEDKWSSVADCCTPHTQSGCRDEATSTCVCSRDVFCCKLRWDARCVSAVTEYNCAKCPQSGSGSEDSEDGSEGSGSDGSDGSDDSSGGANTEEGADVTGMEVG